jgi:ubiquitin-activating enzyme E1
MSAINEALYSRQLYVLGKDAQRRLQQSRVLLCGEMNGLGVEIGKNVALAGVKALTLVDSNHSSLSLADLSTNFYASMEQIREKIDRAIVAQKKIQELNNNVPVMVLKEKNMKMSFDDEEISGFGFYQVVVCVNGTREMISQISSFCHDHKPNPIAFIATGVYGLYTYAFSDFGPQWEILDTDGESVRSGIVLDISQDGMVTTSREKHHGLKDGDWVRFEGIGGLIELNDGRPREIECVETEVVQTNGAVKKIHGMRFRIKNFLSSTLTDESAEKIENDAKRTNEADSAAVEKRSDQENDGQAKAKAKTDEKQSEKEEKAKTHSLYTGGGYFEQVKIPMKVIFDSFDVSLLDPKCVPNDWEDDTKPRKLHAYLRGLWAFQEEKLAQSTDTSNVAMCLPSPGSSEDADAVVKLAATIFSSSSKAKEATAAEQFNEKDIEIMTKLALGAAGQLNPIAALMGGIVGQEVLKACTGKFTPLSQWLHFSFEHCLPSTPIPKEDLPTLDDLYKFIPQSSEDNRRRFDGQAAVFGRSFQNKLGQLRYFLVGAGALGCETLKNLALMGVSCEAKNGGKLYVTDMDAIETSNLNRQFLFRERHIGKLKSETAAAVVKEINPDLNIEALKIKVSPETENVLDDKFWNSLDGVINCLDNIPARLYVDSQCVFYGKPLLESGTLGTKCNTLPIVPNLTESYGSDPVRDESDDIPACTLHAYPNLIEHTLAWAREALFEKEFHSDPNEAKSLLENLQTEKFKVTTLQAARMVLSEIIPTDQHEGLFPYHFVMHGPEFDFAACIRLARLRFEEYFSNKIKLLLAVHPVNKIDKGIAFWSGEKRAPTPVSFNLEDPLHMMFIIATARLYAAVHGIPYPEKIMKDISSFNEIQTALESFARDVLVKLEPEIPEFHPNVNIKIATNDAEAKQMEKEMAENLERETQSVEKRCDELLKSILQAISIQSTGASSSVEGDEHTKSFRRLTGYPLKLGVQELREEYEANASTAENDGESKTNHISVIPQEFEKDDETNGHMDFVFSAASIRARNYKIPEVDKLRARQIVGRIIPAIATTTACATGAIGLELYKLVQNHPLEKYRACNINLAVNTFSLFEPQPCSKFGFGNKYAKGYRKEDYTLWSNITLEGDLTVSQIMNEFKRRFGFEVLTIATTGDAMLYNDMFAQESERNAKITDLYTTILKKPLPKKYIRLSLDGDYLDKEDLDDDGEEDDEKEDDDEEDENDEDEIKMPTCRLMYE